MKFAIRVAIFTLNGKLSHPLDRSRERQSKLGLRRSLGKGKKFQKSFKYLPLLNLVRFYARFIKFALDFSCPLADNVGVGERHETKRNANQGTQNDNRTKSSSLR